MKPIRCGWCGNVYVDPHECHDESAAHRTLAVVVKTLRFTADMLDRKTCAFGEEPLSGALARLEEMHEVLGKLVAMRDENLEKKA